MPDISMCANENCGSSKNCYRHTDSGVKPFPNYQSYTDFGKHNCSISTEKKDGR